jgi:antitoxin HicB
LKYPITLESGTNGKLIVSFPDFPAANSVADTDDQVPRQAFDALETALQGYFDGRKLVPMPSEIAEGQNFVTVPALSEAKILIWNEMLSQQLRKADFARLLDVHSPQVDRLFDLSHSSKMDFVERAANALGKELTVSLTQPVNR